jgi:hypothetical protein
MRLMRPAQANQLRPPGEVQQHSGAVQQHSGAAAIRRGAASVVSAAVTTRREQRLARELGVLRRFLQVYCRARHGSRPGVLCEGCAELLAYAAQRLERCPYDPKPKCKHCPTHCYRAAERAQIKAVMRFSGMYFVRRGRLDWLLRYFLG